MVLVDMRISKIHPPFCFNQLRAATAVAVFFLVFVLN